MIKQCFHWALILCIVPCAFADTVLLKDSASVTGKILAEKRDQVAVDVGYTVLVIPRNQIAGINKSSPAPKHSPEPSPAPAAHGAFYSAPNIPPADRSVRDLVKAIGEAVVQVRTPSGLGSGFIINEDGFLMTNFHVIEGETQISVEVYHQRNGVLYRKTYRQVRIIAINKFEDLALLKIEDKDAPKFKYVLMGNSDSMAVGERVFAIGSPLGLERTVTEGILSTKTRELGGELYLQTTAQINPGNSGGPLFNMSGEVIGITNMKITFGEGLGFAIPVEAVKFFLDHRDAFAYSNDNPSNPYRYLQPPGRARHEAGNEPVQ
ncbi:MAG TPA: trypsin-like peptidase domain-containing protein [Verrucomicrobiae bacterium]|nr:trypsin-like peptidase domain-containing protein [Verrucomicrobiae bacterium]